MSFRKRFVVTLGDFFALVVIFYAWFDEPVAYLEDTVFSLAYPVPDDPFYPTIRVDVDADSGL